MRREGGGGEKRKKGGVERHIFLMCLLYYFIFISKFIYFPPLLAMYKAYRICNISIHKKYVIFLSPKIKSHTENNCWHIVK